MKKVDKNWYPSHDLKIKIGDIWFEMIAFATCTSESKLQFSIAYFSGIIATKIC